jgi:hypothetical protein
MGAVIFDQFGFEDLTDLFNVHFTAATTRSFGYDSLLTQ